MIASREVKRLGGHAAVLDYGMVKAFHNLLVVLLIGVDHERVLDSGFVDTYTLPGKKKEEKR